MAVIGAGNVAMDAARSSLRLHWRQAQATSETAMATAGEVHIVYRRSRDEVPAREEEFHHAVEEGVICDFLTNPVAILGDDQGQVRAMRCIRMELGEPDASGRRSPIPIEGSEFEMAMDTVIFALGTSPNPIVFNQRRGAATHEAWHRRGRRGNRPHQEARSLGGRRRRHRRGDRHQRHGRRQARRGGYARVLER